jgi:tetratricopeptide (TPR) repeat protein
MLIVAAGLMALAWRQWQSGSDQPVFFQGWVEEGTALRILSGANTEVSSGLLVQIVFHLQQAQEFYRRAALSHPLCADCHHHLARVEVLLRSIGSVAPINPMDQTDETDQRDEIDPTLLAGFQRSLTLAPARADLWENIGRFFLEFWPALSKTERRFALTCLEQALVLAPERTNAVLTAAFLVDPDLPAALNGADPHLGFAAARWYQQRGDTERAHRQAQDVVARLQQETLGVRREDISSSLLLLGEARLFLGNKEEAREAYEQGLGQTSDPAVRKDFLLRLGEVQLSLGNKEEAREAYEQGLEQATDPVARRDFYWRLAAWHFERQDFITARDYYRHYLALAPDSSEAVLRLGLSSLRAGNREEGMRWLEQAAGMRPGDAGWQTQLARIFEEAGRYDRANELYHRLLEREEQPRSDLLLHLARNYKQLGLGQQALSAYRRLLLIDANNAEAWTFIELLEGPTSGLTKE